MVASEKRGIGLFFFLCLSPFCERNPTQACALPRVVTRARKTDIHSMRRHWVRRGYTRNPFAYDATTPELRARDYGKAFRMMVVEKRGKNKIDESFFWLALLGWNCGATPPKRFAVDALFYFNFLPSFLRHRRKSYALHAKAIGRVCIVEFLQRRYHPQPPTKKAVRACRV